MNILLTWTDLNQEQINIYSPRYFSGEMNLPKLIVQVKPIIKQARRLNLVFSEP